MQNGNIFSFDKHPPSLLKCDALESLVIVVRGKNEVMLQIGVETGGMQMKG